MKNKPFILLLIGPGGAGKTTAAELLAARFKQCAVIEVDEIRHMIKSGHVDPFTKEGHQQLELSTKNACSLAKSFVKEGFNVIIDDCVTGKKRLNLYYRTMKPNRFLTILLLPSKEIIKKRDAKRTGRARLGKKTLELHDRFLKRLSEETRWHAIDNSKHMPKQTVNAIYTLLH